MSEGVNEKKCFRHDRGVATRFITRTLALHWAQKSRQLEHNKPAQLEHNKVGQADRKTNGGVANEKRNRKSYRSLFAGRSDRVDPLDRIGGRRRRTDRVRSGR